MEIVQQNYISCSCNRTPQCADWSTDGIICYGSCHSIAIYYPEGYTDGPAQVKCTVNQHSGRVNCVRWIKTNHKLREKRGASFVSGSVDKTAVVWRERNGKFDPVATLQGHTGPITTVDATELANQKSPDSFTTYIVTASADSTLIVWKNSDSNCDDFCQVQTLSYGTGFVLDATLTSIPGGVPLLACGCDDHKVHIYAWQDTKFGKVISLHGHEDWVRAVDFCIDDGGDIMLASAGQDYMIRIWRLSKRQPGVDDVIKSVKQLSIDEEIKMRENTFTFSNEDTAVMYAVSLESVLSGHENWIYSICWHPQIMRDSIPHQPMYLLSASMDKTMILWKPDPDSGVWIEEVRVGEVGGNTLGLYGGLFSPDGKSIITHGYQGAFHQWSHDRERNQWLPVVTVSGHFDEVQDLDWDKDGQFVVSVSKDQTTRLHAPVVTENNKKVWYEIARPQVHGYDLQCLAIVNRYKLASGADEKVIRTFEAPRNFIENFCCLCGKDLNEELKKEESQNRPEGASVPALGLSNKAVFTGEGITDDRELQPHPNDQYPEVYFTPISLNKPPSEEQLLQNTLWPETQKLYGHGYEIFSLACDPAGQILASSCKASKSDFAGIILWDTGTWTQLSTLTGHSLTVTQMAFSHCGNFLLAVSRDRTWVLYQRKTDDQPESDPEFNKVACTDKKTSVHSRIIWSCAWSHDSLHFFTASRDKKIMVWKNPAKLQDVSNQVQPLDSVELAHPVTAVDVSVHLLSQNRHLVAAGMENGSICIFTWKQKCGSDGGWVSVTELNHIYSHHLTVKRIRFSPVLVEDSEETQHLASCSTDHSVRIFNVFRNKI